MDERKEIVISVIGGNPFEEGKPFESTSEVDNPAAYTNKMIHFIKNPVQTLEKKIMASNAWPAAMIMSKTEQLLVNTANIEMNRFFSLKEDYMSQNAVNMLKQEVSTIKSIASSTLAGVMTGAKGGIVGMAVGGVIGTAYGVANAVISKNQQIEQYNMQLNTINMQVSYGERRASLVNGGRGTEN